MGHAIGQGDARLALGRARRARRGDELDLQGVMRGDDDGVAVAAQVGEGQVRGDLGVGRGQGVLDPTGGL